MRKFILAIALLFGIIFLFSRFTEIQKVAETLQRGVIWFILAGILIEAIWYINVAASYRYIYQSLGMEEKIRRQLAAGPKTDRVLRQKTNADRAGLWFYETAKNNLKRAGEIVSDGKTEKWSLVR